MNNRTQTTGVWASANTRTHESGRGSYSTKASHLAANFSDNRLISEALRRPPGWAKRLFAGGQGGSGKPSDDNPWHSESRNRKSIKQGERARKAWEEALTLFNQNRQGQGDFDAQFAKLLSSHKSEMVKKVLVRKLEKHREFVKTKRSQTKTPIEVLTTLVLKDGTHPNSLRHLPPQVRWEVLIDETGEAFGAEVESLGITDRALGRIVALAVPAGFRLPELKPDFHAVQLHPNDVTKTIRALFDQPVGVFGFTPGKTPPVASIGIG
ncbi:MAG: hypothetical protein IPM37_13930 [Hahellaceae bacterium]|nr:hypothetical protein [Hahellaceae bacterium]